LLEILFLTPPGGIQHFTPIQYTFQVNRLVNLIINKWAYGTPVSTPIF
jgi:hypothetical protein